jgi:hypothetical protein
VKAGLSPRRTYKTRERDDMLISSSCSSSFTGLVVVMISLSYIFFGAIAVLGGASAMPAAGTPTSDTTGTATATVSLHSPFLLRGTQFNPI